jgi:hypothetical protein
VGGENLCSDQAEPRALARWRSAASKPQFSLRPPLSTWFRARCWNLSAAPRSRRFGFRRGLVLHDVVGGALGVAECRDDRPLVVAENLHPAIQVLGVFLARLGDDAGCGAGEGGRAFGNKLLEGIGSIAKAP